MTKVSSGSSKKQRRKRPTVSSPARPLRKKELALVEAQVVGSIAESLDFLKSRQRFIASFTDLDSFVFGGENTDEKQTKAVQHHLVRVRAAIATELWKRQIFLSVDTIDQILYDVCRESSTPLKDFLQALFRHGIPAPGLIVYPLHSFGVLGLGFFSFFTKAKTRLVVSEASLAISAQTNSEDASIAFVDNAAMDLGIRRKVNVDQMNHYVRSRHLRWFERNPLLVVKLTSFTGGYYENQFIYVLKLKLATAFIMMLSTLGEQPSERDRLSEGSSSRVNNWQTLDIRHYLVLEPDLQRKKFFSIRCVPMNAARLQLAELSDVNADIDPRTWSSGRAKKRLAMLRDALAAVESGYLEHNVLGIRSKLKARVYRKLLDSIDYFRRSYSVSAKESEAIVSLAIAFETLLIDAYAPGVTERIHQRAKAALQGVNGTRSYRSSVRDLFKARGAIVHDGRSEHFPDMIQARRAYIECLLKISTLLPNLANSGDQPIGRLLGVVA